ncbi:MAG: DUF3137 domain-containing protein [Lachnospiraceae bacterium]|nr:DUF3137 domain-containing protein [Lachnospiraceae bacterium]MBQ9232857.1 DUF3137 domain-containing protein [Lachnospiraceae bacterium]
MGIYDTINKLEELRKKIQSQVYIIIVPFALWIVFGMFSSVVGPGLLSFAQIFMIVFFVAAIPYMKKSQNVKKEFQRLYKQTFVTQALSERFQNVNYMWESGFTQDAVRMFNLVQMGNRFKTEDYLSADYNGIHFEQADVTVQYHTSGKNSHTTTYFKGRMFAFDFPYKNVASVRCLSNTFMYKASSKNNKLKLESGMFNKIFKIDAFYEHDAFYFLTPQMMERIESLNARYGNVALHLMGNKLFVAINMASDAFDHDYRQKVEYIEEIKKINRDTQVIVDIIDTLSLYA